MDITCGAHSNGGAKGPINTGPPEGINDHVNKRNNPQQGSTYLLRNNADKCEAEKETSCFLRSFVYFDNKTTTDSGDGSYGKSNHGTGATNVVKPSPDNIVITGPVKYQRQTGSQCDITLIVGPDKCKIKAHRVVLASAFDYFCAMFHSSMKEAYQSEVELPSSDAKTMASLVNFAYTEDIQLNNSNVEKTAIEANFFGMTKVLEICEAYRVR